MKILGVDPGFSVTGFAVIVVESGKTALEDFGFLKMKSSDELSVRVGQFYQFFNKKILDLKITHISLETSFLGKNAQTFLKLGYLRGILYLLADQHKLLLQESTPMQVKAAVTGVGSASKDQVAFIVQRLFIALTKNGSLKHDVTDAVAIALCGVFSQSRDQRIKNQFLR